MILPPRVESIPVSMIRVINARARNRAKFQEIVTSIAKVGMKQPIVVCRQAGGEAYDLVCGQGRLEAAIQLGYGLLAAIVIEEASLEDCYLISLVENIARRAPPTIELARAIAALKERGYKTAEIAAKVGYSETYVSGLLRLISKGEERLVAAVERREIPIAIAMEIAQLDDQALQRSLASAYEEGKLKGRALFRTRRIIEQRKAIGKQIRGRRSGSRRTKPPTPEDLVRAYEKEAKSRQTFVKRARYSEEQLEFIVTSLRTLMNDREFASLLESQGLSKLPNNLAEAVDGR